jgi:Asp-tRNA(Asn)/Glu-tRNA(Gln) amidotransferase B subunit
MSKPLSGIEDQSLRQLVPTDEELRPTILQAMDMVVGRKAILGKTMELLRGRANPTHIMKLIDEELRRRVADDFFK